MHIPISHVRMPNLSTCHRRMLHEAGSGEAGAEHKFRKVHVATAGERVMERLAGIAKGDG